MQRKVLAKKLFFCKKMQNLPLHLAIIIMIIIISKGGMTGIDFDWSEGICVFFFLRDWETCKHAASFLFFFFFPWRLKLIPFVFSEKSRPDAFLFSLHSFWLVSLNKILSSQFFFKKNCTYLFLGCFNVLRFSFFFFVNI